MKNNDRCCYCQQQAVNRSLRKRYKEDKEWRNERKARNNSYIMNRYNTDPEFRNKMNTSAKVRHKERYKYDEKYREKMQKRALERYYRLYYNNPNFKLYHILKAKERKRDLKIRTPIWADFDKLIEIYKEAQEKGLTVDHIIPLRGNLVSGLHVHTNLQLLPAKVNSSKGNQFDPNTFES
jgi:hypothetical protein